MCVYLIMGYKYTHNDDAIMNIRNFGVFDNYEMAYLEVCKMCEGSPKHVNGNIYKSRMGVHWIHELKVNTNEVVNLNTPPRCIEE